MSHRFRYVWSSRSWSPLAWRRRYRGMRQAERDLARAVTRGLFFGERP